ncbi:flagellar hook assembly protein FlgD [Niveispirillum sp. KHB5.9]|uniref:flagellar hook assembly protein FlgD n=1 Tax=Niveispirillum sp. KHB5.9 TaxID=3400269 RepID=UPI003A8B895C
MSISGVSNSTGTGGTSTNAKSALGDLSDNYETFLTLLTSQLQNQDPLQPTDTAEFTKQLVQYSQVEQSIKTNDKLDNVISAINNGQPNQAISYLGKTVEIQSNGIALQDGKAHLTVSTDTPASSAVFEITEAKTGKVLRTIELSKFAGTQDVDWDGLDNNGNPVEDGTYKGVAKITGADGKAIDGQVLSFGRVTGVDLTSTEPYLMLGSLPITMTNVLSIKD